ncbi:hypothetical protein [Actinacidiphila yeochonensis]|uniref:hypothetical protein n=1 Tax=Actinacidiphila yeochonensis TaxID=89050 RepID=UPI00055A322C|nr:hypothetical protein [Actinacidiphila yeochonensis]
MAKTSRGRAAGAAHAARVVAVSVVALFVLASGAWASWRTAQYAVLTKGREQGSVTLAACGDTTCTGPFVPKGTASARPRVTVSLPVRHRVGETVDVVLRPGTDTAIRSGGGGVLYAFLPLGGALLLAAAVVGLGLRAARTVWSLALAGVLLLGGAYLTLPS